MRRIFAVVMLIPLFSCASERLPIDRVQAVSIVLLTAEQPVATTLTDRDLIREIITSLNNAKREPVKFKAEYKIDIKYSSEVRTVLVNGPYANIDGETVSLDQDLGTKLRSIMYGSTR